MSKTDERGSITIVNRVELLQSLDAVAHAISPHDVLEQSSCFVFENGFVKAFDKDVYLRARTTLPKSFLGAVPSRSLVDTLRNLQDKEVEVQTTGESLVILSGKSEIEVMMDPDLRLPTDKVDVPDKNSWRDLPPDFGEWLKSAAECTIKAGQDPFPGTCVHITKNHLESSDAFQFMRFSGKMGVRENCLILAEPAKAIAGIAPVQIAETRNWLHFRSDLGVRGSVRRHTDPWFDSMDRLTNLHGDLVTLPKGLMNAVKVAETFSREYTNDNRVTLKLKPGELTLTGLGISGKSTHRERVKYDGKPEAFSVQPSILVHMVDKYADIEVARERDGDESHTRLIVRSGPLFYVAIAKKPITDHNRPQRGEKTNGD